MPTLPRPAGLAAVAICLAAASALALVPAPRGAANAETAVYSWRRLEDDRPIYGHVGVVDAAGGELLLHAGEDDLGRPPDPQRRLDLDSGRWLDWRTSGAVPTGARTGRGLVGSPLALDAAEGVALALCDCRDGGSFLLDLQTDEWASAATGADPRVSYAALVYDAAEDRAIAIGGREFSIGEPLTTTRAFDLSAARSGWSDLPGTPFQLANQAVDVDPASGDAVAFGGQDVAGNAVAELWRLVPGSADEGGWSRIPAEGPGERMGASLTFVAPGLAVLFGGYTGETHLGDTWLLALDGSDAVWSRVDGIGPEARAAHSASWDAGAKRLIVAGGITGSAAGGFRVLDDVWALYVEDAPATPTSSATPRPTGSPSTPPPPAGILLPAALRRAGF